MEEGVEQEEGEGKERNTKKRRGRWKRMQRRKSGILRGEVRLPRKTAAAKGYIIMMQFDYATICYFNNWHGDR